MGENEIPEIIDPAAIERLRRLGGRQLIVRMIDLFMGHATPILEQADQALQEGNYGGVQRAGHSLKSSAGNVGALRVSRIAAEIEMRALEKNRAVLMGLLGELQAAFGEASAKLDQVRNKN
jgi:HPt (histidine-containing phosphotransfer) domain-containing protein